MMVAHVDGVVAYACLVHVILPPPSTLLVHHDARTGHDERLRAQTVQTSQDARVDETRTRNKLCHKHARHRESVRFRSLSPLKVQWPEH